MDNSGLIRDLKFNLTSVEHCRLSKEWNYKDIISPFSRMYLITDGEASITLLDKMIPLRKGFLYLIPAFQLCSYSCDEYMEQYYTTFTIQLSNNLSIYQLYNFSVEVKANSFHYELFEKLSRANPKRELADGDPLIYQNTNLNLLKENKSGATEHLATNGILSLLLSEFIRSPKTDLNAELSNRILASIMFIHKNLANRLTVGELAERCFITPDHYTRKFKALTRQNPIDYINRQRIEKALLLLNTTAASCKEIGYQCGFNSNTYFCKNFKVYAGQSPTEYRHSLLNHG